MRQQAGLYKLTLYEAKDISIVWVNSEEIDSISNSGEALEFDTENNTQFTDALEAAFNNLVINDYNIQFGLFGLDKVSIVEKLNNSIYGWIPVFEFMNTQNKALIVPFFGFSEQVNANTSHSYKISLKPRKKVNTELVDFGVAPETENENSTRLVDKKFELNIDPLFKNKFTADRLAISHEVSQVINGIGSARAVNDSGKNSGTIYIEAFEPFVSSGSYNVKIYYNVVSGNPFVQTRIYGDVLPGSEVTGSGQIDVTIGSLVPLPYNVTDESDVVHSNNTLLEIQFGIDNENYDIIIDNVLVTKL